MTSKAIQAVLEKYVVRGNRLVVAGRTVAEWAKEFGTPLYLYDRSVIRKKIELFRDAMPDQIKLEYAIKANPNPEIIKTMIPMVDGFDVASIGEFDRAVAIEVNP